MWNGLFYDQWQLYNLYVFYFTLQIAKLIQSMANKHVVGSHFKEEHMQPLHPFAMRYVNEIQVSCIPLLSRTKRLAFSNQKAFKNQRGVKILGLPFIFLFFVLFACAGVWLLFNGLLAL